MRICHEINKSETSSVCVRAIDASLPTACSCTHEQLVGVPASKSRRRAQKVNIFNICLLLRVDPTRVQFLREPFGDPTSFRSVCRVICFGSHPDSTHSPPRCTTSATVAATPSTLVLQGWISFSDFASAAALFRFCSQPPSFHQFSVCSFCLPAQFSSMTSAAQMQPSFDATLEKSQRAAVEQHPVPAFGNTRCCESASRSLVWFAAYSL